MKSAGERFEAVSLIGNGLRKRFLCIVLATTCLMVPAAAQSAAASTQPVQNPFAELWVIDTRPVEEQVPATNAAIHPAINPEQLMGVEQLRSDVLLPYLEMMQPDTDPVGNRLVSTESAERNKDNKKNKIKRQYDVSLIGERGVGGGMNFYSIDKEIGLGKELAQNVEQQAKLFNDPVVNEYVNRLAQNLVRHSDAKVPFTVKIIDNDEINAFALPGGFFYINVGLLMAAENEAELAGVMAHEIAHVAARHATKNATKHEIWNLASIPLIFLGGPAGMAVKNLVSVAVPMSFLKFSRNAEREADLLGVQYQYAAGYDPAAVVNFFEKLTAQEKQKKNFIARAFSTHPMNDDRIKRTQQTMSTMLPSQEQYLITTSEFEEMKARLAKIVTGRTIEELKPGRPTLRKAGDKLSEERPKLGW